MTQTVQHGAIPANYVEFERPIIEIDRHQTIFFSGGSSVKTSRVDTKHCKKFLKLKLSKVFNSVKGRILFRLNLQLCQLMD